VGSIEERGWVVIMFSDLEAFFIALGSISLGFVVGQFFKLSVKRRSRVFEEVKE